MYHNLCISKKLIHSKETSQNLLPASRSVDLPESNKFALAQAKFYSPRDLYAPAGLPSASSLRFWLGCDGFNRAFDFIFGCKIEALEDD